MDITGIRYTGPVFDSSGYGKACRGNILALHQAGVPITINPISFENSKPDLGEDGKLLKSLVENPIPYNINFIHTTPEFWSKYRQVGKINCGFTIWETTKLHSDWTPFINNSVDKVLVGCEWNREIFKDSGVTIPIGVVPHGISTKAFDSFDSFKIAGVKDTDFVFYNICQWTERKCPQALIRAYYHAFNGNKDVVLVLKTYGNDYSDQQKEGVIRMIKSLKYNMPMSDFPKMVLIGNMLSEDEITSLHTRGDCYVSLDRGEGFGLSSFTAGAAGNPIVVTGFGGATEYAKEDNSYLVNYMLTPVHSMPWSPWYDGTQLWAEPDVLDGANKMKYVYENQNKAKEKGMTLKNYIKENFSWEVIADKIITEIKDI